MAQLKDALTPWRRFVGLLKLEKRDIRQIILYAVFAGLVALSLPLGIQAIINLIQGAQVSTSWIVLVVLVTLGVAFQGVLQLMQKRLLENMQQRIFARSSFEFAYRFPRIKIKELHNIYPPELANRFFDTLTVQKGLSKILIDFPAAILQIVFGLLLLSFYHPFFIIYGILLILLIYIVFKFTAARGLQTSLEESEQKYQVAHWLQEIARSITGFKMARPAGLPLEINDKLTSKYLDERESHFRILMLQYGQMVGFKVLVTAGLLIIGGLLVLNQKMNIGQFVAAEIIILLIISSVEKLVTGLESFYDVLTSLEKLGQVVDKEIEEDRGPDPFDGVQGIDLQLDKVCFSTPDGFQLLKDISMKVKTGDRIMLSGFSGSGKTTLLKMLSSIILPSKGMFYINDSSVNTICLRHYRSYVGQLLPGQTLFEGSIRENITLGTKDVDQAWLHEIMDALDLSDFVKEQPEGVHTIVFTAGQQMSSTIGRKILLARAIFKKPRLLLMKDPLENLPLKDAEKIAEFLSKPEHPWALVVSGHNPVWAPHCMEQISLEAGRISKKSRNA